MDALRNGEQIRRGLIAEFIGDAHKSARIGLPVYSIGGGPGYLWGASFDDAGKGSLRISAVDASALAPPAQTAPLAAVAPSPPTPSPEIVPIQPPEQQGQVGSPPVAAPAEKPALKTMDVVDFLVDWKSLVGQTVTVTGCSLEHADTTYVACSAGSQGSLFVHSDTLAREDLRRALRECAGFENGDECRADVTGNVSGDAFGAELTNAAIKWAATAAPPASEGSVSPSPKLSSPTSEWFIAKDETDPFDPAKSNFVAGTRNGMGDLAIRCLDGKISLLLISGPSNASVGASSELKIVADSMPVREEQNAQIMEVTTLSTSIEFGDEKTLEYLRGVNLQGVSKISVRYSVGDVVSTVSFEGGKSLADAIPKALKACGQSAAEPRVPTPQPALE